MSDTFENPAADGIREGSAEGGSDVSPRPGSDDVRDEVRLDLDEGSLDTWDEVRGDYALDPASDMARPALSESEVGDEDDVSPSGDDDEEDRQAEDEDGKDGHTTEEE